MAYGELAEGDRVYDAAENLDVDDRDLNELQDQLAALLGPRDIVLPLVSHPGGGSWVWNEDNDPPRWEETAAGNDILHISMPVHEGMVIDTVILLLGGNADGGEVPDGEITIYRAQVTDATSKAAIKNLDITDPWALGGNGPLKTIFAGLALTIAADYIYWLELASCGGGGGGDESYYYGGILSQAQLGA